MSIMSFKVDRECAKCGSLDVAVQYEEKHNHLRKICKACGFHWLEYPKDHGDRDERSQRLVNSI